MLERVLLSFSLIRRVDGIDADIAVEIANPDSRAAIVAHRAFAWGCVSTSLPKTCFSPFVIRLALN